MRVELTSTGQSKKDYTGTRYWLLLL